MKLNRSTTRRPRRRQSHHHHPSRAPKARTLPRRRESRGTAGGGWSCPGRRRGRRRGQSGRRRLAPLHWGRRRGGVHGRELNQRAAKGSGSKIRGERAPPHGVGRRRRLSSDPHAAASELQTPAVMAELRPVRAAAKLQVGSRGGAEAELGCAGSVDATPTRVIRPSVNHEAEVVEASTQR